MVKRRNTPNYEEMTLEDLVDRYGKIKPELDALERDCEKTRAELLKRNSHRSKAKRKGSIEVLGNLFRVTVTYVDVSVLDTDGVRAYLGKRLEHFLKSSPRYYVKAYLR